MPPVKKRKPLPARRGHSNLPSNPYAAEAKTALRLEDRPGYPFAARKVFDDEPELVLKASEPHAVETVELLAKLFAASGKPSESMGRLAVSMRAWLERNSRAG